MRTLTLFALTAALALAAPAGKPEKGFKALFNGKDLTDWTKAKENEDSFKVKDGAIVAQGPRCHLYYTGKNANFKNFELKVDVMTQPKSNGGIYIHTAYQEKNWPAKGFEIQVNNSHTDWRRTGGLYAVADNKEHVHRNHHREGQKGHDLCGRQEDFGVGPAGRLEGHQGFPGAHVDLRHGRTAGARPQQHRRLQEHPDQTTQVSCVPRSSSAERVIWDAASPLRCAMPGSLCLSLIAV